MTVVGAVSVRKLVLLNLAFAFVASGGHPDDTPAKVTFSNSENVPTYIFWQRPEPTNVAAWPPAAPKSADDVQRVKCYLARRSGAHVGSDTRDDLKKDLVRKGEFVITVRKDWAPKGAERFLNLVSLGFFNACPLFRAVAHFLVQFGVSTDVELENAWGRSTFPDDPLKPELLPLPPGTLAFAGSGPNSRTSQLWLSFGNGVAGKQPWETPVGYVHETDNLNLVKSINTEYGDLGVFGGKAPDPHAIGKPGNVALLRKRFPNMDYLESCSIIPSDQAAIARHSRGSAAPDGGKPELIQVEVIPPGEKRSLRTSVGHVFVAKRGGPEGEIIRQIRVNELDEMMEFKSSEL